MTNKLISKEKQEQDSILSQALANMDRPQPTPLGVFKLARKYWLDGRRISIGDLAKEVGVSRVTLYRWVGSREGLIEEILWSFAKPTFENAIEATPGHGVKHILGVHRHFMSALADFDPLRRYVSDNPTAAIRIQTSKDPKSCHNRIIDIAAKHIEDQVARGYIKLPAPAKKLAEMMVHSNGALLYSAIIGGHTAAAIDQACAINHMLLLGKLPDEPNPTVKRRRP